MTRAEKSKLLKVSAPVALWLVFSACSTTDGRSADLSVSPAPNEASLCPGLHDAHWVEHPGLPQGSLRLANWNIKKGSELGWESELASLADSSQILLLQEAIAPDKLDSSSFAATGDWHYSFAQGYHTGTVQTGVMTAARVPPVASCHLSTLEPWLRTPKATNFTRFAIDGSQDSLLVVNVHVVNFAVGLADFRAQLAPIQQMIALHDGPVLLAGDFNTWRRGRQAVLDQLAAELELAAVEFSHDQRVTFMGSQLDHVYARGLSLQHATSWGVASSDHNPMTVEFTFSPG